jgi:hypothetical protein
MRVGLSSIYAWRPHVEHLAYLNDLITRAGHQTYSLVCDAQLTSCYTRELKQTSKIKECLPCMAGGLRSFHRGEVDTLGSDGASVPEARAREMTLSSAKTLFRTEAAEDIETAEFKNLHARLTPAGRRAYASAHAWIEKQRLDALLVFNGRMDATRALLDAALDSGIPVVTVERTWFSDGLLLVPNDGPLDLKQHHRLNLEFRNMPLTRIQASLVAQRIASRFQRTNNSEWRAYNMNSVDIPWPAGSRGLKILILPSSRNEVDGHPDWANGWSSFADALDITMDHLGADRGSAVIRCHPVWGERIGAWSGKLSESYYSTWAKKRGIYTIPSTDTSSSLSLMAQADLIIVNGGSAVFEASALGKPSITLGPATYSEAGFCGKVFSPAMLSNCDNALALPSRDIIKLGLRFGYTHNYRHSQFTRYVKAISPTEFKYFDGADAGRIVNLLKTGQLVADDDEVAADGSGEDEICDLIVAARWKDLASFVPSGSPGPPLAIQRRFMLRWLDRVRKLAAKGDL